jgi:hypothetical protein
MNGTKLKKRIRESQKTWETARDSGDFIGMPGFIDGVKRGYQETLRIVHQYQHEEVEKACLARQPLSRWNAILLYRACRLALQRLRMSDRAGAMHTLERALKYFVDDPRVIR